MIRFTLRWRILLSVPFFFFMRLIGKCSQLSDLRLFGPAGGGLPVDVGKAGEMLRVFVL